MANRWLQRLFFALFVRPLVAVGLGLNVRDGGRLPETGPAILVANHNSHLDTLVLMTLLPGRKLHLLRPVAAEDYFCRNKWLHWFATRVMNIIPLSRDPKAAAGHPLAPVRERLEAGEIVILFPEGSRGEPEQLADFQSGIAHLAKMCPDVPVVAVWMHGLGKALPKGDWVFVPFFCDVFVGESWVWPGKKAEFMETLTERMAGLRDGCEAALPDEHAMA